MAFLPIHDDNPRRWIDTPYATWGVTALTCIIYIWQAGLGDYTGLEVMHSYGFIPSVIFGHTHLPPELAIIPSALTALTTQFLHGDAWHLIGNMMFLYIFGDNIEDRCGHWKFVVFYLLCGAVGAMAHGFFNEFSQSPLIGASGSISGILGAYLVLQPTARITAISPILIPLRLPVWIWVGAWFLFQALASGGLFGADNVAYWAHIGGFIAGVGLVPLFKRDGARLFEGWRGRF